MKNLALSLSLSAALLVSGQAFAKAEKKTEAPAKFQVLFETTKGSFKADFEREWAPKGVDRFYELVKSGFFKDIALFRVLPGFVSQFGIHGDPKVAAKWENNVITDDPVKLSNNRGHITFATAGPNTRTTQLFINYGDNARLDKMGFSPIGKIDAEGMKVVDQFYSGYGEGAPQGNGPSQDLIQKQGNEYLKKQFEKLDYIKSVKLVEAEKKAKK